MNKNKKCETAESESYSVSGTICAVQLKYLINKKNEMEIIIKMWTIGISGLFVIGSVENVVQQRTCAAHLFFSFLFLRLVS